jgi:hypothetical protein
MTKYRWGIFENGKEVLKGFVHAYEKMDAINQIQALIGSERYWIFES